MLESESYGIWLFSYLACRNNNNCDKYSLPAALFRNLYSGNLTLGNTDLEQSMFMTELIKSKKIKNTWLEKRFI